MFCYLCPKKSWKVIAISHPLPKNQMQWEAMSAEDDASAFYEH